LIYGPHQTIRERIAPARMNPYASLSNSRPSQNDVFRELQGAGWGRPAQQQNLPPGYYFPDAASYQPPPPMSYQSYPSYPVKPAMQSAMPQFNEFMSDGERVADWHQGEGIVSSQRILEEKVKMTPKKHITIEKVIEVPQTIIKERTRYVSKPEIIERLIEVPHVEYEEREMQLPATYEVVEQIVEIPEIVIEERIVHVPKVVIQERLIDVPKIEFREIIEYEDRVEYREVPVDKIIEVPEIEYVVREVEHFIPQQYQQEVFQDRYVDVPVVQVQEVERIETVPIMTKRYNQKVQAPVPVPQVVQAPAPVVQQVQVAKPVQMVQQVAQPVKVAQPMQMVQQFVEPVKPVQMVQQMVQQPMQTVKVAQPMQVQQIMQSYASYDPKTGQTPPTPRAVTQAAVPYPVAAPPGSYVPPVQVR